MFCGETKGFCYRQIYPQMLVKRHNFSYIAFLLFNAWPRPTSGYCPAKQMNI